MHLFHVYLHHGHINLELHLLRSIANLLEYMADHAWNHTSLGLVDEVRSEHRMCFSTCCLAICEYSSVESFHDAEHDRLYSLLVYIALWRVGVENLIIIECVRSAIACRVCSMYLHCVLLNELDELCSLPIKT